MSVRDLIIVGGGPSGLAAAINAKKRGIDYQVIEQGVLVNSIYRFPPQMVFFTTPELLEIGGLPFTSPYEKPTRAEALNYYRKVVDTYDLQIAFEEKVVAIRRDDARDEREREPSAAAERERAKRHALGVGPQRETELWGPASMEKETPIFEVETRSERGVRRVRLARFVILAIGYYDHPNYLGIPGEDLPHVHHYYKEPHIHYRQRVVIVGGGNSAAESALEMFRAGAHVTIVHRAPQLKSTIKYWVRPDIENRIKEGSVTAKFGRCVKEIRPTTVVLVAADGSGRPGASGGEEEIPADAVYLLTGYRADTELMCRAGVMLTERQG